MEKASIVVKRNNIWETRRGKLRHMPDSHRCQTNTEQPTVTFQKASTKSSLYIQIWGSYSGHALGIKFEVRQCIQGKRTLPRGSSHFSTCTSLHYAVWAHREKHPDVWSQLSHEGGLQPFCHLLLPLSPAPPARVGTEHDLFSSIRHGFLKYSVTDISLQVVDAVQTILFLVFCLCFCLLLFLHEPCSLCCCFLALLPPSLQLLWAQQVLPPGWLFPEACEKGLEKERSIMETNYSS